MTKETIKRTVSRTNILTYEFIGDGVELWFKRENEEVGDIRLRFGCSSQSLQQITLDQAGFIELLEILKLAEFDVLGMGGLSEEGVGNG